MTCSNLCLPEWVHQDSGLLAGRGPAAVPAAVHHGTKTSCAEESFNHHCRDQRYLTETPGYSVGHICPSQSSVILFLTPPAPTPDQYVVGGSDLVSMVTKETLEWGQLQQQGRAWTRFTAHKNNDPNYAQFSRKYIYNTLSNTHYMYMCITVK